MVRAWYMDSLDTDQRLPHMTEPPQFLDTESLKETAGVLCFQFDADKHEEDGKLRKIREDRGYDYGDIVELEKDKLPNYDGKIKAYYTEHIHSDEEIRFILEGRGYFDVRDREDKWIRVEAVKGDLLILPAGIYHRFTMDTQNYIKIMRLFAGVPVWTPINRPADEHPARLHYVKGVNIQAQSVAVN